VNTHQVEDILLKLLGVGKTGKGLIAKCPAHNDRTPSLSLKITEEGRLLTYCFAGCSFEEIRQALCLGGEHFAPSPRTKESPHERERLIDWLNKLADGSGPVTPSDPVDHYLRSRNIHLDSPTRDLRTHMALGYWEEEHRVGIYPAMIGIIRSAEGLPVGFHRTWLSPDGQKAPVHTPKKLTSLLGPANAVQLSHPGEWLAIAEGIETALSFRVLSGIPTWSCISSGGIARFVPPPGIKILIIAGDYDEAGIEATEILTKRLTTKGIEVKALFPDGSGQDWNDVLREMVHG